MIYVKYGVVILAVAVLLFFLAGCSYIDRSRDLISIEGAEAADAVLNDAEWVICKAASIGAVTRRYGGSAESMAAYINFCERNLSIPLLAE